MLKTKGGRAIAGAFVYGITLDVGLAFLIGSLFASNDFWFGFFVSLMFLWVGPVILSLKSSVYKALFFFLSRNGIRSGLVQEFRKAQLPLLSETNFNDPADLYFSEIAEDDSLPKSARIFAAQSLGQLALIPNYSLIDGLVLRSNVDAALATYFDELRRDNVRVHGTNSSYE